MWICSTKASIRAERKAISNFKSKRHKGSGNEIVDYFRAPCLGADQKARGLWELDCDVACNLVPRAVITLVQRNGKTFSRSAGQG